MLHSILLPLLLLLLLLLVFVVGGAAVRLKIATATAKNSSPL